MEDNNDNLAPPIGEKVGFEEIAKRRIGVAGMRGMPTERARQRLARSQDPSDSLPASEVEVSDNISDATGAAEPLRRRSSGPAHTPVFFASNSQEAMQFDETQREKASRGMWIAIVVMVFALLVATGFGGYSFYLNSEIARLSTARDTLVAQLNARMVAERDVLAQTGFPPADEINGWVTLRSPDGVRVPVAAVGVKLYQREDIEIFLAKVAPRLLQVAPTENEVAACLRALPEPLAVTMTTQDGAFKLKLPELGQYVLYAELNVSSQNKILVWLLSFTTKDVANTPIEISSDNAIHTHSPHLMLRSAR